MRLAALTTSQNRTKPKSTQKNAGISPLSTADCALRAFTPGAAPSPGNATNAITSAAIDSSQIQYAGKRANSGTRNATLASMASETSKKPLHAIDTLRTRRMNDVKMNATFENSASVRIAPRHGSRLPGDPGTASLQTMALPST
jgi:hypothetical protein